MSTSPQIVPEPINSIPSEAPAIGIINNQSIPGSRPVRVRRRPKLPSIAEKRKTPIPAPTKYKDLLIFLRGGADLGSGPELGAISEMDDLSSMGKIVLHQRD